MPSVPWLLGWRYAVSYVRRTPGLSQMIPSSEELYLYMQRTWGAQRGPFALSMAPLGAFDTRRRGGQLGTTFMRRREAGGGEEE